LLRAKRDPSATAEGFARTTNLSGLCSVVVMMMMVAMVFLGKRRQRCAKQQNAG
jgi:hypothetical protein